MNIKIKKYHPAEDYEKLIAVIKSEGEEWEDYLKVEYQESLEQSITYVAYVGEALCGYSRSMNDFGFLFGS